MELIIDKPIRGEVLYVLFSDEYMMTERYNRCTHNDRINSALRARMRLLHCLINNEYCINSLKPQFTSLLKDMDAVETMPLKSIYQQHLIQC